MKVAFLGLGIMGAAMARNVARSGHSLTVWNRTSAKAEALALELAAQGVRAARNPAEAARDADAVITMLADPTALEAVVCGTDGALPAMAPGGLLIDMSTVDPGTIARLATVAATRGVTLLDAPVSGSRKPATDGTLLILAAGTDEAVARARPLLESMGNVRHVGASGAGSSLKLVLNGLGAHMLTGFTLALVLAKKLGLDPVTTVDVILSGAFSSPLYAAKAPRILARDFSPDFSLALMRKDQDLVLDTARAAGVELPSLATIRDEIAQAVEAGFGEQDLTALIRLFEARAGVTVAK